MAEANGKPIVVAVDGSAPGWEAMDTALYLASLLNRPVDVMTVLQHRKSGYFAFIDRHLEEEQQTYAQKILEEAAQRGQKAGVEVRPHLLEGEQDVSEIILVFPGGRGPGEVPGPGQPRPQLRQPPHHRLGHRAGDPGGGPPRPAGAGPGGAGLRRRRGPDQGVSTVGRASAPAFI